eukprot:scaffold44610_cov33-Phaeocystis_antarctica.AAC.1
MLPGVPLDVTACPTESRMWYVSCPSSECKHRNPGSTWTIVYTERPMPTGPRGSLRRASRLGCTLGMPPPPRPVRSPAPVKVRARARARARLRARAKAGAAAGVTR